jgi:hypothetical protein
MAKEEPRWKKNLEEVKKLYELERKRYGLPGFEELDEAFEVSRCEACLHILREIRRAINARLQWYADMLEPVLNPHSGSLHSLIESKIFEKGDTKELYELYKEIWSLVHEGIARNVAGSDRDEADYIKLVWKNYRKINQRMAEVSQKLAEGWKKQEAEEEKGEYLG